MKSTTSKIDILKYVLSILLFLFTLVTFPSIASFIFLLIGIIILPSIWKKLINYINNKLLIVICIILFFVGCFISPTNNNQPTASIGNNVINNEIANTTMQNSVIENTSSDITNTTNVIDNQIIENTVNTTTSVKETEKTNTQVQSSSSSTKTSNTPQASTSSPTSTKNSSKSATSSSGTSSSKEQSNSDTVWVGETGSKYHYQSCPTLKGKGHPISLSEAKAQGREPCKVCH